MKFIYYSFIATLFITISSCAKKQNKKSISSPKTEAANQISTKQKKKEVKREYWNVLQQNTKLTKEHINALKNLERERKIVIEKAETQAARAVIKKTYAGKKNELLGRSLALAKLKFDAKWKNPLSSINLFHELNVTSDQRKKINAISQKYFRKWRKINKAQSKDEVKTGRQDLIQQKLDEIKSVLNDEQFGLLKEKISQVNDSGIKGIYPF